MRCGSSSWKASGSCGAPFGPDPFGFGRIHRYVHHNIHQAHRDMHRQMRRDQRAAHLRQKRRWRDMKRQSECGPWWVWMIGPMAFFVFPVMFGAGWRPSLPNLDLAGLAMAPLRPISAGFGDLLGVSPAAAGALLFAALVINAGAAVLALAISRRRA